MERCLPDNALAAILGRLPPRDLAAAQRVCTAWRGIIDDRRLLLRQIILPHYVHGLFINYVDHNKPHFFARPPSPASTATTRGRHIRIDGRFRFIVRRRRNSWYPMTDIRSWYTVLDHCNGLVVLSHDHFGSDDSMYVCNPATRRWARLPLPCSSFSFGRTFLVFDPAAAATSPPHYEVLWTQREPENPKPKDKTYYILKHLQVEQDFADSSQVEEEEEYNSPITEEYNSWRLTEWPPWQWAWREYSSRTRRWEERVFVREGEAAGTLSDLLLQKKLPYSYHHRWRYAAYWQGAPYVHCRGEYVSRLSLANNTYQVIKSPTIDLADGSDRRVNTFLGKSEKGVYFGAIDNDHCQLQVWILNGQTTEWVLIHRSGLKPETWKQENCSQEESRVVHPWILDDYSTKERPWPWILDNYSAKERRGRRRRSSLRRQHVGWDSDDDNIIDNADADVGMQEVIYFLGFHPYKEVIFLSDSYVGVAYHLNTSKTQYLGMLDPKDLSQGIGESFVYTPCMLGV